MCLLCSELALEILTMARLARSSFLSTFARSWTARWCLFTPSYSCSSSRHYGPWYAPVLCNMLECWRGLEIALLYSLTHLLLQAALQPCFQCYSAMVNASEYVHEYRKCRALLRKRCICLASGCPRARIRPRLGHCPP